MLSKMWKKIGLLILIIACLWNITAKLVNRISFDKEIDKAVETIETSNESKNNK